MPRRVEIAELPQRLASRVIRRHTSCDQLVDTHLEMQGQLVIDVGLDGAAAQVPEIGLRLALGATPTGLVVDFAAANMRPVVIGWCIGVLLSVAASSLLQGLLSGLDPLDATTYLAAVGLFRLPASIAVLVGVRSAGTVDQIHGAQMPRSRRTEQRRDVEAQLTARFV